MKLRVSFEIEIPDDYRSEEIMEWLRYELGETNSISGDNPVKERMGYVQASNVVVVEETKFRKGN